MSQIVAGTEMVGQYLRVKAMEERTNAIYKYPRLEDSIYMTFAVAEVQAMAYGARKRYDLDAYHPNDWFNLPFFRLLMKNQVMSGIWKE